MMEVQFKQEFQHLQLDGVFALAEMCADALKDALAEMDCPRPTPQPPSPTHLPLPTKKLRTPLSPLADCNGMQRYPPCLTLLPLL